jgi:hypothetical protein
MAGKPPLRFSVRGLLLTMRHPQRLQRCLNSHLRVTWARSGCAEMRECLRPEWGYGTWSSLTRSTRRWRNPLHKPNTQQHDRDNQPLPSQHLHQAGLWHNTRDPQHTRTHTHWKTPLIKDQGVAQSLLRLTASRLHCCVVFPGSAESRVVRPVPPQFEALHGRRSHFDTAEHPAPSA